MSAAGCNWLLTALATVVVGVPSGVFLLTLLLPWLKYDLQMLWVFVKVQMKYRKVVKSYKMLLIEVFENQAQKTPDNVFVIFEGKKYTYGEVGRRANKLGNALCSLGIRQGDPVALMDHNGIDFVVSYLALAKLAAPIVLINTNQKSASLLHSLNVSQVETVLVGNSEDLISAVAEIQGNLENQSLEIYVFGDHGSLKGGMEAMDPIVESSPDDPVIHGLREGSKPEDPFCYIFTSGTTGLPKAAILVNWLMTRSCQALMACDLRKDDVVYVTSPLYHTSALVGMHSALAVGATIVLKKKFSASNYINDCIENNVTYIMYVGEMCRFLLATPPSENDRKHKIRVMSGNGLRKDIWTAFVDRFGIPEIIEFYGSTEGNVASLNMSKRPGACGRLSPLFTSIFKLGFLVEFDYEKGEVVRNAEGFCVRAVPFEKPALLIGKMPEYRQLYKDAEKETEKKILRNVFKKGDMYYNSGDLFTQDKDYFMYFADRTGDTFRWKGENVSTTEVSNQLTIVDWIEDASVYGVAIQGSDGKAGMAALKRKSEVKVTPDDLCELYAHCNKVMPTYAVPRFLRIQDELNVTATFKQTKTDLVRDGFDPSKVKGHDLYVIDFEKKSYVPMTEALYESVNNGTIRL